MSLSDEVLAVIIGRAGSRGLPGKNALTVAGRPMVCHAIAAARDASTVGAIVVSTDGAAIAQAARSMNVEVVDRPACLAGDEATVDAAVRHAVEATKSTAKIIVILYANVPVRPAGLIDLAVRRLRETGAGSVQSYAPVGKHHPHWMVTLDDDGRVQPHHPNTVYRRQDLPPLLLPDGGVIAVARESLGRVDPEQPHAFLGHDRRGVITAGGEVVDVDGLEDLRVAEARLAEPSDRGRAGIATAAPVVIGDRTIDPSRPPYIVAEIGVNHDGSTRRALELVDTAAAAGADAVKLQLFETDRLLSRAAKLAAYQEGGGAEDPFELLRRLELSAAAMSRVVERTHDRGMHAVVTIFTRELVADAEVLPFDAYKTASTDIINRPLIDALVATGKPLILSTGAASAEEVAEAMVWVGGHPHLLMHCVSSYPTPDEAAALGGRVALAAIDPCALGYSDHTTSLDTGALAVAGGACMLEKHLTHDHRASGPDHAASLTGMQFGTYVKLAHRAWRMRGPIDKAVTEVERDVRTVSRQSLTTIRALQRGHVLRRADLTVKRPGTGISPARIAEIEGLRIVRDIEADVPLTRDHVT